MDVFDKGLCTILRCTLLFVLLSLPLILRRVPRNPLYGYRTRLTLSNDQRCYEVNAYFAGRLLAATLLTSWMAPALYLWHRPPAQTFMQLTSALLVAPVVFAWLLTIRFTQGIVTDQRGAP